MRESFACPRGGCTKGKSEPLKFVVFFLGGGIRGKFPIALG